MDFQSPRGNYALSRRLRRRATPVAATQQRAQTESAVVLATASTGSTNGSVLLLTTKRGLCRTTRERLAFGIFVRILLPLVNFLLELLCLFLICKAETRETVLELESVEERPILIVGECVVDLLIPQNTTVGGRNVDQLDEVGVAHQIIGEDRGALQAGVGPSVAVVWVSNVELGNGDSMDLVGSLRYGTLDSLLVVVRKDGWHGGGVPGRLLDSSVSVV